MNMKWFIPAAVVIIIAVLLFIFRAPIMGLFNKQTPVEQTPTTTEPELQHYSNATMGISLSYPIGFTLNPSWQNTSVVPTKPISGVQLTIPASMATGTNLSSDTYVSVEQLPRAKSCTGDIFLAQTVTPVDVVDNGVTYSVASTTDAAAGNRYEETVYAIKGSSPCTAVRYLVHYGVFENYPAGTIVEFNRTALLNAFDTIRHSLVLGAQGSPTASTTSTTSTQ